MATTDSLWRRALRPIGSAAVVVTITATLAACGDSDPESSSTTIEGGATEETEGSSAEPTEGSGDETADAAGDSSTDTAEASGSETTDASEAAEPAGPRGDLAVGYVGTVDGLGPFPQGATTNVFRLAVFDPLISIDQAGNPVAALAESWDFAADGLSLTLHLRDGVTFHDGTPFDADVAVQNIEMFGDPATGVQGAQVWAITTASATDSSTVELTFERPAPEIFAIMNTALVTKPGALDSGIGTGAFVVDEFNVREGLRLSANPDYWDEGKPGVATLELREFSDPAAAALAAQAGDLDVLLNVQPNQVVDLENAGMTIDKASRGVGFDILVNVGNVPDARVRRALSLAFDRERFVDTIMMGFGTPMSNMFPPSSPLWANQTADVTPFDLDAAKALLDEAGVTDLEIAIMSPPVLPLDQFLPIYQQDLASIGIDLTIEPVDPATWGGAVSQPGAIPDTATHAYAFADLDPALIFSAHPFRVGSNASAFVDPEYERLVTEASATVDIDERYDAFRAVADYVTEQAFMFPVANPLSLTALGDGVGGYEPSRAGDYYSTIVLGG